MAGIAITRVFGDFANGAHSRWLDICRTHGLEPVLHCSPVTGKNGTDILVTIAAMDFLATGAFRRIVLVSGDSDFLPLVRRLRAGGAEVIGVGRKDVSPLVSAAYSKWFVLGSPATKTSTKPKPQPTPQIPAGFGKAVQKIIGNSAMSLAEVGKLLRDHAPELAPPPGSGKLKKHILAAGGFEVEGTMVSRVA